MVESEWRDEDGMVHGFSCYYALDSEPSLNGMDEKMGECGMMSRSRLRTTTTTNNILHERAIKPSTIFAFQRETSLARTTLPATGTRITLLWASSIELYLYFLSFSELGMEGKGENRTFDQGLVFGVCVSVSQ
jgi:hypothetical protein